eukprot:1051864-Prymnesium_polylepis.1
MSSGSDSAARLATMSRISRRRSPPTTRHGREAAPRTRPTGSEQSEPSARRPGQQAGPWRARGVLSPREERERQDRDRRPPAGLGAEQAREKEARKAETCGAEAQAGGRHEDRRGGLQHHLADALPHGVARSIRPGAGGWGQPKGSLREHARPT